MEREKREREDGLLFVVWRGLIGSQMTGHGPLYRVGIRVLRVEAYGIRAIRFRVKDHSHWFLL